MVNLRRPEAAHVERAVAEHGEDGVGDEDARRERRRLEDASRWRIGRGGRSEKQIFWRIYIFSLKFPVFRMIFLRKSAISCCFRVLTAFRSSDSDGFFS